jgi:DNA-binding MurR/RpiR family transcriptional regulator
MKDILIFEKYKMSKNHFRERRREKGGDMVKNIFTQLKTEYEYLTQVEKRLADLILADPRKFILCSMAELSQISGVSQGSIHNFSRKFSSSGFSALKLRVAGCIAEYDEQPFAVVDKDCGIKAAMELKMQETVAAFRNALEMNDELALERTAERIMAASKVELYGVFQSAIVAKDFCYGLIQLGIPAAFVEDSLMCSVSASMLDKNSLVIAVSSTGQTKEVIDAVTIAQNNGVPVICLTSNKSSLLARIADEVLLAASSGISISDRSDEIRMTQLLLVDTLCSYMRSIIDTKGEKHYYKLRDILSSHSIKD